MWEPGPYGGNSVQDLTNYVLGELQTLAAIFQNFTVTGITLAELHSEPNPFNGLVAYADGTDWNPGYGRGPYFYNDGEWIPMFEQVGPRPVSAKLTLIGYPPKFTNTTQRFSPPAGNLRLTGK